MPLILKGARQVGKTYVLQEWGRQNFARMHTINFEQSTAAAKIFERDFDVQRIHGSCSKGISIVLAPFLPRKQPFFLLQSWHTGLPFASSGALNMNLSVSVLTPRRSKG